MNKPLIAIAILSVLALGCKPDGAWVSVDGSKLTERDIEKEMPEEYKRMREQYNSQIREILEQLAVKKMMELAAKKEGVDVESYSRSLMEKAPAPTDMEVAAFYEQIKRSGQTNGQSLPELRGRIQQHLREQAGRDMVQAQIGKLKKTYNYTYDYTRVKVETAGFPDRGNPQAKVTIVEYSDFECPFCIRVQPTTAKIREKYGDKVRWVFKDFPLSFHPNAMTMHIGARCVYRVNKNGYWKFFDTMFGHDRPADVITKEGTAKVAAQAGTDMAQYQSCVSDPAVVKEIQDAQKSGEAVGVSGTPAFFINGRMLSGAQPQAAFEQIIDEEL
ncbi:MAG: thioredoxin domain-containing protein [Leptospirales bacterium]|nr:thioredoxin domain-containing protein [Leptospirales bacterium]